MAGHRHLNEPEFDLERRPGLRPSASYIVCSTPRSGSSLLADGMGSTHRMGLPVEYINQVHIASLSGRWGSTSLDAYVTDLLERRTDATGAFAIKMHWAQLVRFHDVIQEQQGLPASPDAVGEAAYVERYRFIERHFPNPRFIHITRLDRLRQAVSWYIGALTGEWSRFEGEAANQRPAQVPYDLDRILAYLVALDAAEASWREFFRVNELQPVTVLYEDLEANFQEAMATFLRACGASSVAVAAPRLKKQADASTELLVRQAYRDLYTSSLTL